MATKTTTTEAEIVDLCFQLVDFVTSTRESIEAYQASDNAEEMIKSKELSTKPTMKEYLNQLSKKVSTLKEELEEYKIEGTTSSSGDE